MESSRGSTRGTPERRSKTLDDGLIRSVLTSAHHLETTWSSGAVSRDRIVNISDFRNVLLTGSKSHVLGSSPNINMCETLASSEVHNGDHK